MSQPVATSVAPGTQSRDWLITQPAKDFTVEDLFSALDRYDAFAGQLEEGGATGYEHFQVYLHHSKPIRFSTLKKRLPKAHLEPRRGSKQQALEYVTKDDTRVGEPFFHGEINVKDNQGKRTDLEDFHSAIVDEGRSAADVLLEDPRALRYGAHLERLQTERDNRHFSMVDRDVTAHFLHGATGTGKTSGVLGLYQPGACYRVSNYRNPFDAYRGERVLILDEFDGSMDFGTLLNILDRYPMRLPARYSDKWAAFSEVWVVSNLPLTEFYPEIQRLEKPRWKALLRRLASNSRMLSPGYVIPEGEDPSALIALQQMREDAAWRVKSRAELYRAANSASGPAHAVEEPLQDCAVRSGEGATEPATEVPGRTSEGTLKEMLGIVEESGGVREPESADTEA